MESMVAFPCSSGYGNAPQCDDCTLSFFTMFVFENFPFEFQLFSKVVCSVINECYAVIQSICVPALLIQCRCMYM